MSLGLSSFLSWHGWIGITGDMASWVSNSYYPLGDPLQVLSSTGTEEWIIECDQIGVWFLVPFYLDSLFSPLCHKTKSSRRRRLGFSAGIEIDHWDQLAYKWTTRSRLVIYWTCPFAGGSAVVWWLYLCERRRRRWWQVVLHVNQCNLYWIIFLSVNDTHFMRTREIIIRTRIASGSTFN